MTVASAARHALAYVMETTPGVTPATPVMLALRHTSCSLGLSRDSFMSEEKRADRQVSDVRTGSDKIAGNLGFEPSFGEYDPLLEACLAGTWTNDGTNDVLDCGVVERSLTIERSFTDIGQSIRHRGCYLNKLSLSVKPNAMSTGSFDIIGLAGEVAAAPLSAVVTPSQSHRQYDAYSGALKEGGTTIAVITSLDLSLDNGISPQYVIGQRSAAFVSWGRSTLTGTMTAFFTDAALITKFLSETPTSLECTLGDGTAKSYTFLLPNVRYTGADVPMQADGPLTLSMPFSAVLDTVLGTNFRITRID